jgi:hypothetical protein
MRIIDNDNKKVLDKVLIMLTVSEAKELADMIESLDPTVGDHIHVDDIDYKREITVAIYTDENQHYFAEEIRKIIADE